MAALQEVDRPRTVARLQTGRRGDAVTIQAGGDWVLGAAETHDAALAGTRLHRRRDAGDRLRRARAARYHRRLAADADAAPGPDGPGQDRLARLPAAFQPLIETIDQECNGPAGRPSGRPWLARRSWNGSAGPQIHFFAQAISLLGFLGMVAIETVATDLPSAPPAHPRPVHQMEETGINALPIVGLLSFLIGIVLAYQGADQLAPFGAEIFTVNLLGIGDPARDRRADHRHHRRRPLGQRLHRPDRHHARQRGDRRACRPWA